LNRVVQVYICYHAVPGNRFQLQRKGKGHWLRLEAGLDTPDGQLISDPARKKPAEASFLRGVKRTDSSFKFALLG